MTKARKATATVTFVDEHGDRYQDLFPDVRGFEQFNYLLVGRLAEIKRKTLPAIAKAVGADAQALHHLLANAPWSVQELRTRHLTFVRQALAGRPFILCIDETGDRKKGHTTDYVAHQYIGNLGMVSCPSTRMVSWIRSPSRCSSRCSNPGPGFSLAIATRPSQHSRWRSSRSCSNGDSGSAWCWQTVCMGEH